MDLQRFTKIKSGFSERRRMPLLGRIRLGQKVQKVRPDGSTVEFPRETPHFVVPSEVADVYGDSPTVLDIMLPNDNPQSVFPQSLAWFGSSKGLKCTGDLERAERLNDKTGVWEVRSCPCEHYKSDENPKGECTESGTLKFILPRVSMGGTWQCRTGSYHSVVDINSGLDYIRALIGRIAMVPLKLRRVARETHAEGKKQVHYTLSLILDANVDGVNQLRNDTSRILSSAQVEIEAPINTNPLLDAPDVIEVEAEALADMDDAELAGVQAALKKQAEMKGTLGVKAPPATKPSTLKKEYVLTPPATTPTPPPAQMLLEEPPVHKYEKFGTDLIPPHKWSELIQHIDTNPDLACLKEDWKAARKVDNVLRLTVGGQQNLLAYFRESVREFPY